VNAYGVNVVFNMTLVTKMLDTYVNNPIAAFVFGSLPDPNPSNNYHEKEILIT
jgi:hypothetical protein